MLFSWLRIVGLWGICFGLGCSSDRVLSSREVEPDSGIIPDEREGLEGRGLMTRLLGLWSGPVTDTRLGDFPLVNMDFRPAGDSVLFGRVDLDAENSLRFAFAGEVHDGRPLLVFRNGGLFRGRARDTRTRLVEATETSYRFCAISGGCDYTEATFDFSDDTHFLFEVRVRNSLHERWEATRVESRTAPSDFPVHLNLTADSPFPPLPTVTFEVGWSVPLNQPADVWLILSQTSCIPPSACQFSRWIKAVAETTATSVDIVVDQVHPGTYSVLAVVDHNGNLLDVRSPDSGDLISVPSPRLEIPDTKQLNSPVSANFTL